MKKIIILIILMFIIGTTITTAQQVPMFNSYTLNQFLINPSYAGVHGKTNIFGINRIQFAGFEGAPVTYMMTGDVGFKDKKFGLGGALFSDRNNLIAQNGFQFAYAYNIKLSDSWKIAMGLNAGMVQWTLNFDQLRVDDLSESVLSNVGTNTTTFRSDFGLRLTSEKIDFGIAIPQMVSSKVKYSDYLRNADGKYTTVPHYIANLSYLLALKEGLNVKPMVVVRGAKGAKPQIDIVGLLDWKSKAYASVGYRTGYAVSIGGGVKMAKGITFGYAFDRPLNDISKVSVGSHEFVLGITIGDRTAEKPEPANGLSKEAETKLKIEIEKQIQEKLSTELENKLKMELEARVNKAVEEKIAKTLLDKPSNTTPSDGKTAPSTGTTLSKEDIDKIKKEIEEKVRKQMEESFAKLIDEKVKKAMEAKPAATETTVQPNKEELERLRKESEEKIKKEVEEKLRKEINKAVEEKMQIEIQKAKEEALKNSKDSKMSLKDKATLDSLKMKNLENEKKNLENEKKNQENEKRIAELEKQLKGFTPNDRIENEELKEIGRIVRQYDLDLKQFKTENRAILDKAADAKPKKSTETTDEPSKFVLVLAGFKTLKEAQQYQKLAAQTFEFPGCKILKSEQTDNWYFVYQKSFDKKSKAWEAHTKLTESKSETPNYPWIFVSE
ncbi:MAG: PorP/SprF family type IX secretion system membrane protein [Bacteroidia bacterium]